MRKIIIILFLLSFSIVKAAVDADLKGSLQLKGSSKSSESFLDLLKCGLEEIPKMFLRKEKIKASYTGATKVTLEQDVDDDAKEKFLLTFRVPSILRVATKEGKKEKTQTVKSGTAGVECAKAGEVIDNTGSSNDNFSNSISKVIGKHHLKAKKTKRTKLQRKQNKVKNFLRGGSTGLTFSIKNMVAVRKGNKGKVKATIVRKKDKALGRFVVKFDYK